MRAQRLMSAAAVCGALTLAACGSSSSSSNPGPSGATTGGGGGGAQLGGTLNGAGATFPQPVYQQWASDFKQRFGTTVNYQGIGSGGGVAQFTAKTVQFGASDAALKDAEVAAAQKNGQPVHIPTVLGAVTVAYNLPGVAKGLQLDGKTVADIFLGKVTTWSAPSIKALNPQAKLPSSKISVCHRSDASGTTKNFAQFLADYSPAWKSGPGVDKSVKWPTGTGAKGNDGVAGCIKQNQGGVGYVEQAFALQNGFTTAAIKNKAGQYVEPTLAATAAAAESASPPADLRFSTINGPGASTYPIAAVTFLLVYKDVCKAGQDVAGAKRLKTWLNYAVNAGQQVAPKLQYAPLPESIRAKAQQKVDSLVCNGQAVQAAGGKS